MTMLLRRCVSIFGAKLVGGGNSFPLMTAAFSYIASISTCQIAVLIVKTIHAKTTSTSSAYNLWNAFILTQMRPVTRIAVTTTPSHATVYGNQVRVRLQPFTLLGHALTMKVVLSIRGGNAASIGRSIIEISPLRVLRGGLNPAFILVVENFSQLQYSATNRQRISSIQCVSP